MRLSTARRHMLVPFALALVVVVGAPGVARADTTFSDDNQDIAHAAGPLASAVTYAGDFSTANDRDWFVFYVNGAKQTQVSATKVGAGCSTSVRGVVLDQNGNLVNDSSGAILTPGSDSTDVFRFTTGGPGRYYVEMTDDCAGDPYQLRVGPPEAITTDPALSGAGATASSNPLPEPNDSQQQAGVPLEGGVNYSGSIDSVNDIDEATFVVKSGAQVDVAITKVGDGCSDAITVQLLDGSGDEQQRVAPQRDQTAHFQFTSDDAAQYYLRVSGSCSGDPYQLRVDPSDALLPALPPPPPVPAPTMTTAPAMTTTTPPASSTPPVAAVVLPPAGPAPAALLTLSPSVTAGPLRSVLRGVLRVTPGCSIACSVSVKVRIAASTARKHKLLKRSSRATTYAIGTASATAVGPSQQVPVPITPKARHALRNVKRLKVTVVITAKDAASRLTRATAVVLAR